jgi:hypothetical protein
MKLGSTFKEVTSIKYLRVTHGIPHWAREYIHHKFAVRLILRICAEHKLVWGQRIKTEAIT